METNEAVYKAVDAVYWTLNGAISQALYAAVPTVTMYVDAYAIEFMGLGEPVGLSIFWPLRDALSQASQHEPPHPFLQGFLADLRGRCIHAPSPPSGGTALLESGVG